MIKTFLRRFKLGLFPTLVVSFIIGLIAVIVYLTCVSDIFAVIFGISLFIFMIYLIGKAKEKSNSNK